MTALLGLIVQRDMAIENFVPVDYFALLARFKVTKGDFRARWKPYPNQAGLDEKGRLLDRRLAEQLNAAVQGKTGKVVEYSDTEKTESAPLPFSVDQLQILASKKFGYKSDAVLKALQSLYESMSSPPIRDPTASIFLRASMLMRRRCMPPSQITCSSAHRCRKLI